MLDFEEKVIPFDDVVRFLGKVIPSDGVLFLAEHVDQPSHPRGGYFKQYSYDNHGVMADAALKMSRQGKTMYHACASFKQVIRKATDRGFTYDAGREQENVQAVKSLWLDLDVQKPNSPSYNTAKDALNDVVRLCHLASLPAPLIVSSGTERVNDFETPEELI